MGISTVGSEVGFYVRCKECGALRDVRRACSQCELRERRNGAECQWEQLRPGGVFRNLEIVKLVAAGGMGRIFEARQPLLDRHCALKVLHPHVSCSPQSRCRFEREAKALAALSHPHIVTIYDCGREGELFYFTMEYVKGETLFDRIRRGAIPLGEAVRISVEVCEALEYAHAHGILHRDIKPSNILLDAEGSAKVADFGVAKLLAMGDITESNAQLGTAIYMAPEQIEAPRSVDARADLYSLAVALYEMTIPTPLTGRVEESRAKVPSRGLAKILARALSRQPSDRHSSLREFREELLQLREPLWARWWRRLWKKGAPASTPTRPSDRDY